MAQNSGPSHSIAFRLGTAVALLLAVTLALLVANVWMVRELRGESLWTDLLAEGGTMRLRVLDLAQAIQQQPEDRGRLRAEFDQALADVDRRYVALREGDPSRGTPPIPDPQLLASVVEREQIWRTQVRPLVARIADAESEQAALADLARVRELTGSYLARLRETIDAAEQFAQGRAARFEAVQIGAAALLATIAVAVLLLARAVVRRVRTVAETASRIAKGDLTLQADLGGSDELAQLGQAFDRMTAHLKNGIQTEQASRAQVEKLLVAVRDTATRLATSTREILTITQQQSTGAHEQAGAVTETQTVVNQLAAMSQQAADRARDAAETARHSDEEGRAGRRKVDESLATMTAARSQADAVAEAIARLAEQVQAVGEIIAVVDDISDQTSLLSLNAAIEATRAGEQGKAFSILAGEVRALSEQAKKATVDVRRILGDVQQTASSSVASTEQYSRSMAEAMRSAESTGDTLRALLGSIAAMATNTSEISDFATQQAQGLEQINLAMRDVKLATERSVSAVQQTEQAVQDLSELAVRLSELLAPTSHAA